MTSDKCKAMKQTKLKKSHHQQSNNVETFIESNRLLITVVSTLRDRIYKIKLSILLQLPDKQRETKANLLQYSKMYGEERKTQQKENISNEKWFFNAFFYLLIQTWR